MTESIKQFYGTLFTDTAEIVHTNKNSIIIKNMAIISIIMINIKDVDDDGGGGDAYDDSLLNWQSSRLGPM